MVVRTQRTFSQISWVEEPPVLLRKPPAPLLSNQTPTRSWTYSATAHPPMEMYPQNRHSNLLRPRTSSPACHPHHHLPRHPASQHRPSRTQSTTRITSP